MTISDENFQELVQCLGRWALAYLLNCSAEDIDIKDKTMKNTSPKQDQTLLTLCALFMSRKRTTPKELPRIFDSDISHLIHGETSTGNALRTASGGELHKIPKNMGVLTFSWTGYVASPWLFLYCTGLSQPSDFLMRVSL